MPLTLNELYTQTKHQYHLSMIAGKTGIDHIMNWVYVSEDSSTHDFLKGGELIITTGINYQDVQRMLHSLIRLCGIRQ